MEKENYIIEKILNNNVILAKGISNKREYILIGKGIGFKKKSGMKVFIDKTEIQKSFQNFDSQFKLDYFNLLNTFDKEMLDVSSAIIKIAEDTFGPLHQNIHIVLTDHLSFAIERLRESMYIPNPFLDQIKILLKEEYKVGQKAAKLLQKQFNIRIPEEEVGFIAFHINAARKNTSAKNVIRETRLFQEILLLIEEQSKYRLKGKDFDEMVKYLNCLISGEKHPNEELVALMGEEIKIKFPEEYYTSKKIFKTILSYNNTEYSKKSVYLLTLHLSKCNIYNKNKGFNCKIEAI